jgi:hypothetical protein
MGVVLHGAGCDVSAPATKATKVPAGQTPAAPPGAILAEDATGIWNQPQVEQYLREDLKLTQVSLTPSGGDGNYTGTGTTADGRTLQLQVKQVPGGIACDFQDDRGGSGRIAFGNLVEQNP